MLESQIRKFVSDQIESDIRNQIKREECGLRIARRELELAENKLLNAQAQLKDFLDGNCPKLEQEMSGADETIKAITKWIPYLLETGKSKGSIKNGKWSHAIGNNRVNVLFMKLPSPIVAIEYAKWRGVKHAGHVIFNDHNNCYFHSNNPFTTE